MTNLILVRHGETTTHAENRYTGRTDVPLTDRGHAQAWLLAQWAARAGLDGVVSSNMGRARDTAQPCVDVADLELRIDPRLRELDFGAAEGLTTAQMQQQFPTLYAAFVEDPANNPLPDGEEPKKAVERGMAALHDICRAQASGRVLVVAHTTLIRLMLCRLLGLPLSEYRRVFPFIRNCGLTEVLIRGERVSLLEYNTPTDLNDRYGGPAGDRR